MSNEDYIEYGGYQGFIRQYGRCAITGEAFSESEQIGVVLLPDLANWPFPVWGDYPLGANAKAMAFVKASTLNPLGIPLGSIREATQCDGTTITYHPVTYKIAEADATITIQAL